MIEDGTELIVNRFQIRLRIGLTSGGLPFHDRILPADHISWLDFPDPAILEIGKDFGPNDMLLAFPGILLQPAFHIADIKLRETAEGHIERCLLLHRLLMLPCNRLPPGCEAPSGALLQFPGPVGIAVIDPPGSVLFLIDRHLLSLLSIVVVHFLHKVLSVYFSGYRQVAQFLQLPVQPLDDLIGIGLGNIHFLCHLIRRHE